MTWGGLDEIFNPGSAHLRDEMKRRRVEAKIPGTEGEPNSVNLEQGIVRITVPRKQDAPAETPQDALIETPQDAPAETPQDAPVQDA